MPSILLITNDDQDYQNLFITPLLLPEPLTHYLTWPSSIGSFLKESFVCYESIESQ